MLTAIAGYEVVSSQSDNGKHDTDGDGLIEIEYLEQLNAIRYDLDGDGMPDSDANSEVYASAFPGTHCATRCSGYGLVRSLDFRDASSYASGEVNTRWTSGDGWAPIGVMESPFNSTLDGNGHVVSNLYIRRTTTLSGSEGVGFFGSTGENSNIRRVALINVDVRGVKWVGGLIGANHGTVADSYSTGVVSGDSSVGGMAGTSQSGEIISSYSSSRVSGDQHFAGGLVGFNYKSKINNSYAMGEVTGGEASEGVGGLVGHNSYGIITASYATGQVLGHEEIGGLAGSNFKSSITHSYATGTASGDSKVGGLIGRNHSEGMISSSYATGNVSGRAMVGGLVGENRKDGFVDSSFATGAISGSSSVGGLIGHSAGKTKNTYASGDVSGELSVGGLVGNNNDAAIVSSSYASGMVSGKEAIGGLIGLNSGEVGATYAYGHILGDFHVGGLIGRNRSDYFVNSSYSVGHVSGNDKTGGLIGLNSGRVVGGYWDIDTSGQASGAGFGDSTGIEGKTTAELQSPTGYTGVFLIWKTDLDNADHDFDPTTGVEDFWDFGTSGQYPALEVDFVGDGTESWEEFGNQVRVRPTPVPTPTPTPTPTLTPTPMPTPTPTLTPTPTPTPMPMPTPTLTPTPTPTPTPTFTPTPTPTPTPTLSVTTTPVSPANTPSSAAESGGGACGLPSEDLPLAAAAINLSLLVAPIGMIWGVKWRGGKKRTMRRD